MTNIMFSKMSGNTEFKESKVLSDCGCVNAFFPQFCTKLIYFVICYTFILIIDNFVVFLVIYLFFYRSALLQPGNVNAIAFLKFLLPV